jgi:hypothetical protein
MDCGVLYTKLLILQFFGVTRLSSSRAGSLPQWICGEHKIPVKAGLPGAADSESGEIRLKAQPVDTVLNLTGQAQVSDHRFGDCIAAERRLRQLLQGILV